MTHITPPSNIGAARATIRQVTKDAASQSPFTGSTQVLSYDGQWWEMDVTLPPMTASEAAEWLAFGSLLRGRYNTFSMGIPGKATARGSVGGTPLVNGSSQTGSSLIIDGATTSQTGWIKAADFFQLGVDENARLYMATADANSDGSGNVTMTIWPDLVTPLDNATVTVSSPVGAWRMASPDRVWDIETAEIYGLSFTAVSVVG